MFNLFIACLISVDTYRYINKYINRNRDKALLCRNKEAYGTRAVARSPMKDYFFGNRIELLTDCVPPRRCGAQRRSEANYVPREKCLTTENGCCNNSASQVLKGLRDRLLGELKCLPKPS